ncbi:MAG: hypothetical protein HF978_00145 [Desulfobacteraceae bacterium]|nr:hypothetical protein [Desulfobacteraceae bacterium]MBC2753945.1 hypothetical protein [Desulfobacteraceae bacterium]
MKKILMLIVSLSFILAFSINANAAGNLFWADSTTNAIIEVDPDTGAEINSMNPPVPVSNCTGLAYADGRLFYTVCGDDIYELNPTSGAVINSFSSPVPPIGTDALGFSGTELYVQDWENDVIYVLNPGTGAIIRTLNPTLPPDTSLRGGISYAGGRNSIFATDVDQNWIFEINASTGSVINFFNTPAPRIFGVGFSYANNILFVGSAGRQIVRELISSEFINNDAYDPPDGSIPDGDTHTIYALNPDSGATIYTLDIAPVWGLAADENVIFQGSIPTLNEWGMIIFIGLASIIAFYFIRRRTFA